MDESARAAEVIEVLKLAKEEPAQKALPILNGLIGLATADHEAPLELEEARSSAFLAICEIGKALHRGQPTDDLWGAAMKASERWLALAK